MSKNTRSPENSFSRLNYHHLGYFWAVVRAGGVAGAAQRLHTSQATISEQIKALERSFDKPLLIRRGNRLETTPLGQSIFRYANEIFSIGNDLMTFLDGEPGQVVSPLHVGIADAVPKLIAVRLLEPVLSLVGNGRLMCVEDRPERLLDRLASHELDMILTDHHVPPSGDIRTYHHLLGDCGVTWCASKALVSKYSSNFPSSLHKAPVLLPVEGTTLRQSLDQWFVQMKVVPNIVGEFADSALLKAFGRHGHGIFPVPTAVEDEVFEQYHCGAVGRVEEIRERYYAISVERRLTHPAMVAIAERARGNPIV